MHLLSVTHSVSLIVSDIFVFKDQDDGLFWFSLPYVENKFPDGICNILTQILLNVLWISVGFCDI